MTRAIICLLGFASLCVSLGCSDSSETAESGAVVNVPPPPTVALAHHHPREGPHGGRLIELGHDHRFHAELVEDNSADGVVVYILDEHFRELRISEMAVTLHLMHADQPASFELRADTDGSDAGHSRFVSTDPSLLQLLAGGANVSGKLRVTIDGVPYMGRIALRQGRENRE